MAKSTQASVLAALRAYGGDNLSTSELQEKAVLQTAASKYADMIQEELYGALGLPQQYIQQSSVPPATGSYFTKEELAKIVDKYRDTVPFDAELGDRSSPTGSQQWREAINIWGDWHKQQQSIRNANRQSILPIPQSAQAPIQAPVQTPTPEPAVDLPVRVVDKTPSMPKARRVGGISPFDPEA